MLELADANHEFVESGGGPDYLHARTTWTMPINARTKLGALLSALRTNSLMATTKPQRKTMLEWMDPNCDSRNRGYNAREWP